MRINNRNKKKLILAFNADWFALSHFKRYIEEVSKNNFSCYLFAEDTGKLDQLKEKNVKLFPIKFGRSRGSALEEIFVFIKILFSLLKIRPHAIEIFSIKPILTWGLISKLFFVRYKIFYITGLGSLFFGKKTFKKAIFLRVLKFILSGNKSFHVVENNEIKNILIKDFSIPSDNILLLNGVGINIEKFKEIRSCRPKIKKNDSYKIIMASRLLIDKGLMEYLHAANLVESCSNSKLEFFLAGKFDNINPSGVKPIDIEHLIKPNGNVLYLGHVDDIPKLLTTMDIFVLPSYHEGMPKSIIEATSIGLPTITTDVIGCRESIIPGKTGLLVKHRDIHELAKAIKLLTSDSQLYENMSAESIKYSNKNFDENKIALKHMNFISKLN